MTSLTLTAAQRMQIAHEIAHAAACLDCIQSIKSSPAAMNEALLEARGHVEKLQRISAQLAGDRAGEIFCPEDSADVSTLSTENCLGILLEESARRAANREAQS